MTNKKTIVLSILLVLLLLIIGVGGSYAFFTAAVSGSETTSTIKTNSGTLGIVYADGTNTAQTPTGVYPRADAWVTKNFTVTGTNTTELSMPYTINLVVTANTFTANALKYTLTGTNTDDNGTVANVSSQTGIATGAGTRALGSGSFANGSSKKHTYQLKIFLPETNKDQNSEKGKKFAAYVTITSTQAS